METLVLKRFVRCSIVCISITIGLRPIHAEHLPLISRLTLREKIGQLIMVGAYGDSRRSDAVAHEKTIEKLIKEHHIGGLIFMSGLLEHQIKLTQQYQSYASIKLLMSTDAEYGLCHRLTSSLYEMVEFPRAMTLGALEDTSRIYNVGAAIGKHLRKIGLHMNLAPVCDVNSNPNNPIINVRSFGDNPYKVAEQSAAFIQGMQSEGIIATPKHAPGHGDTEKDSHTDLPISNKTLEELENIELIAFRKAFDVGAKACMVAHIALPSLHNGEIIPSSLSYNVVTKLIRERLNFQGLIITDSLNMKFSSLPLEEIALQALKAGNDMLLFCQQWYEPEQLLADIGTIIDRIEKAVISQEISIHSIDDHVERIFKLKEDVFKNILDTTQAGQEGWTLIDEGDKELVRTVYKEALTLKEGERALLPFMSNETSQPIALLKIGGKINDRLSETLLHNKIVCDTYRLMPVSDHIIFERVMQKLSLYDTVIVALHGMSPFAQASWGISRTTLEVLKKLRAEHKKIIIVLFGSPYSLSLFEESDTMLIAYQDHPLAEQCAGEIIAGVYPACGKLPIRYV